MTDSTVDHLVVDLLEWIGAHPRPYREVLDAWRTSCPRLPVWEEARDRGLVVRIDEPGAPATVAVSAAGRAFVRAHRGVPPMPTPGLVDAGRP
ncbi:MAG TPA: hypothetical protein VL961_12485 [Acidimicrobiales bacterium]|nr:hypothetical protein [Acidimicrobiales bacterium]